jgi:hypothetical protein
MREAELNQIMRMRHVILDQCYQRALSFSKILSRSVDEAEMLRKTWSYSMSVSNRKTPHATLYVQTPYPSIPKIISRIFPTIIPSSMSLHKAAPSVSAITPAPSKFVQLEAATEAAALLAEDPEEPAFLLVRL